MMTPDRKNRVFFLFFIGKNIADSTHLGNVLFLEIFIMLYIKV